MQLLANKTMPLSLTSASGVVLKEVTVPGIVGGTAGAGNSALSGSDSGEIVGGPSTFR